MAIGFWEVKMQYIRRPIANEGNPNDPEIVGLVKFLKPIFKEQKCVIDIDKWLKEENYNKKSKALMWYIVNGTSLIKSPESWL
jgi:hypothetical protein